MKPCHKRVLVSGANGFVGRPLCEEMSRQGWQVRAAVRSSCQLPIGVESVVVGAIDGETDWTDALHGVDVVIHLAARVHVIKDMAVDPLVEFFKVNVHGTVNLARQSADVGVRRFVFLSSVKVHGEETSGIRSITEGDSPDPQDHYSVSKWQAEQALHRVVTNTGLEVVVVRPPLVYGPGVKGNFIRLLTAIDRGIPLPLAGANKNVRSLLYVGNLVDALIACALHPVAAGQTYLLSDSQAVSTAILVEKIVKALGCVSRLFYVPPVLLYAAAALLGCSAQIDRLFGSLQISDEKIRRELNWTAPYTLEQGLRATADWYRREHNRL